MQQLVVDLTLRPGYILTNGLIRYQGKMVIGEDEGLRRKIIEALHNSPLGRHSSIVNTYHKVKKLFHWPGLKKYVMEFMLGCDTCRRCKSKNVAYPRLIQPLEISGGPWESISMDFIKVL